MKKENAKHALYPVTADDENPRNCYQVTFAIGLYVSLSGLTGRAMVLEFSRGPRTVEAAGST
jgi:hypothetical protein